MLRHGSSTAKHPRRKTTTLDTSQAPNRDWSHDKTIQANCEGILPYHHISNTKNKNACVCSSIDDYRWIKTNIFITDLRHRSSSKPPLHSFTLFFVWGSPTKKNNSKGLPATSIKKHVGRCFQPKLLSPRSDWDIWAMTPNSEITDQKDSVIFSIESCVLMYVGGQQFLRKTQSWTNAIGYWPRALPDWAPLVLVVSTCPVAPNASAAAAATSLGSWGV